jgi:hypothetical protein
MGGLRNGLEEAARILGICCAAAGSRPGFGAKGAIKTLSTNRSVDFMKKAEA